MNWDAIGAVGEIVGALAVFLTLIYLAVQIRQNTSAVRASALDSTVGVVTDIRARIFESAELTDIYYKGLREPDALSQHERDRFTLVMHNIIWGLWNMKLQSEYASLSADIWASQQHVLFRVYSSPGGRWFLREHGQEFPESFIAELDAAVAGSKDAGAT